MKVALYTVLLLAIFCSAQTPRTAAAPIGDAYGVAAMRVVIATQAPGRTTRMAVSSDEGKQKVLDLLQELEAQISSPAEQASYDGIVNALKLPDSGLFLPSLSSKCATDLKYLLKHRDGTIPTSCLKSPEPPTDKRYNIPDQLPDPNKP